MIYKEKADLNYIEQKQKPHNIKDNNILCKFESLIILFILIQKSVLVPCGIPSTCYYNGCGSSSECGDAGYCITSSNNCEKFICILNKCVPYYSSGSNPIGKREKTFWK